MIITIVVAVLAAAGITTGVVIHLNNQKEAPSETVVAKEEVNHDNDAKSYLTGEWLNKELVNTRPIAVMTENTKVSLPQYGLNSAGVIYEAPVEGSYTRLMAIYDDYKSLEKIGNVRSCRPYYAYFAAEFEAFYVHFGQCTYAEPVLNSGIVDNLNGLEGEIEKLVFYRTSDRKAPHNAYVSAESIAKGIEHKGYNTAYSANYQGHYIFAEDDKPNTLSDGEDAAVVKPYYFYNKPYFIYDKKTGLYERYQFGKKQIDGNDEKQVAVKNIIFQNIDNSIYDSTEYLNITLTGRGEGKYFTNGKMIDIYWEKDSNSDITRYYDTAGNEIVLNQGQTWVCMIQNSYADKSAFYSTVEEFEAQ